MCNQVKNIESFTTGGPLVDPSFEEQQKERRQKEDGKRCYLAVSNGIEKNTLTSSRIIALVEHKRHNLYCFRFGERVHNLVIKTFGAHLPGQANLHIKENQQYKLCKTAISVKSARHLPPQTVKSISAYLRGQANLHIKENQR